MDSHEEEPASPHQNATSSDFFDYERKKNKSFGSTRNTFNIRTMSQFYHHNHYPKVPHWKDIHIWNQSATSWTRDQSPQHKFPQQKRFSSVQEDRAKAMGDANRLHLRSQLKEGRMFPCSKRKDYFPPQHLQQNPAPWTYNLKRWLEQTGNVGVSPSKFMSFSTTNRSSKCYSSIVRGRTITKEVRDNSKYYLDHARVHVNHHQGIVRGHPGVGRYSVSMQAGKHKPAYTMGELLHQHKDNFPAPNAYKNDSILTKPSTAKATFDRGRRLDLAKPLNNHPGPGEYRVSRYLEGKKRLS